MFNWLKKKLFQKKVEEHYLDYQGPETETYTVTVWATIGGPFQDPSGTWTLLVKVAVDGEITVTEFYFENFDSAYKFETELLKKQGPMDIELPVGMEILETEYKWEKQ